MNALSDQSATARQSYVAWFTTYPSTHEKAGQTVEVVTREWAEAEFRRLASDEDCDA